MLSLEDCVQFGGIVQFGILIASALVPGVLDWKRELQPLSKLLRQLIWVHGAFIVLVIVGFGLLATFEAGPLADGSALARGVCGFIAVFWFARLVVQFFVFDATPYLTRWWLWYGYQGLTAAFAYLAAVFGVAALH